MSQNEPTPQIEASEQIVEEMCEAYWAPDSWGGLSDTVKDDIRHSMAAAANVLLSRIETLIGEAVIELGKDANAGNVVAYIRERLK